MSEMSDLEGAVRYERTPERRGQRKLVDGEAAFYRLKAELDALDDRGP